MNRRGFVQAMCVGVLLLRNTIQAGDMDIANPLELEPWYGTCLPEDMCVEGTVRLRHSAMEAWHDLRADAIKAGLDPWLSSSYRSFKAQLAIWNKKYTECSATVTGIEEIVKEVMQYTAIPGTSRHHWGTDFDITDGLGYFQHEPLTHAQYTLGGEYQYLNYWLEQNAHKYQIYQVYTRDKDRKGFRYEPWHYSYRPLAKATLDEVLLSDFGRMQGINQIKGHQVFDHRFWEEYKEHYLLGINTLLL